MNALNAITHGQPSYLNILDEAWQAHLAPRQPDAPTVVSLFSGAGGSSLGYSMAGYRELLAVEWDAHAVACFKLNFPDVPVFHGDIAKLSGAEALRLTGLQPGELDVLDGSPPCQGFSTAGKRVFSDPRNGLFREYVRLLEAFQPKAFIMENVSGMVKGKMKLVFAEIMRALKGCGYKVSTRLMNAMYFHVPQSRARMIFIGIREDLSIIPSHPKAIHRPFTVDEALTDVPDDPDAFTVGSHTKIWRAMQMVPAGGHRRGHHSHIRLPLDRPSPSLLADSGFGHYHYWHPSEHRVLTFIEFQRLASFGDQFLMRGDPGERWARLGNSVPPLFMRAIAAHVATLLTPRFVES